MTYIVLDEQQAKILSEACGVIGLRDQSGRHLGFVSHGFTDDDIEMARKRLASDGPRYTTAEVLDHLQRLTPQ